MPMQAICLKRLILYFIKNDASKFWFTLDSVKIPRSGFGLGIDVSVYRLAGAKFVRWTMDTMYPERSYFNDTV